MSVSDHAVSTASYLVSSLGDDVLKALYINIYMHQ